MQRRKPPRVPLRVWISSQILNTVNNDDDDNKLIMSNYARSDAKQFKHTTSHKYKKQILLSLLFYRCRNVGTEFDALIS